MKKINVKIPAQETDYEIEFPPDFGTLNHDLKKQIGDRNYIIVTDENILEKSPFFQNFEFNKKNLFVCPPGESEKHWKTVNAILNRAFELDLDRSSVFIVVGGGVYGDLVGFAASVFMRGIPFVQVPTSLLAMVDSSVGGKTGFDNEFGKNLVGSFNQPEKVFCCRTFLETLPKEEIQNGIAEMVKHGILGSQKHFENLLEIAPLMPKGANEFLIKVGGLIRDSIKIKKQIVELDEKELGVRGYLNLGHTFGHAIEQLSNFEIPHGRAVAIGCVMASQYAAERKICDWELVDQIENIFNQFEIDLLCDFSEESIFKAMQHDKKKKNGKLRLILPRKLETVEYFELEA